MLENVPILIFCNLNVTQMNRSPVITRQTQFLALKTRPFGASLPRSKGGGIIR